jgi:hypothetical protein
MAAEDANRSAYFRDVTSRPLSAEQLWSSVVKADRGFLSSPAGSIDGVRKVPATLPPGFGDPKFQGVPVGKGYETFAAIQLLDRNGRRVEVGTGFFDGGGPDNHAEARALRGLEKWVTAMLEGGRMMVVVEKEPCASCRLRLIDFASKKGLTEIEVYLPERESMTRPGQNVTSKQASRTSFQAGRPPTVLRKLPVIRL